MKNTIGIFRGKQEENNRFLLETLYNEGPLSAWELTTYQKIGTKIIRTPKKEHARNRMSLHAIYNKRLHGLEKKEYVTKEGRHWIPTFKGFLAVLLIESNPKPWNEKYSENIKRLAKSSEEAFEKGDISSYKINDRELKNPMRKIVKRAPFVLDNLKNWIDLSQQVKMLMEKGVINFDIIKQKTLLTLLFSEVSRNDFDALLGD